MYIHTLYKVAVTSKQSSDCGKVVKRFHLLNKERPRKRKGEIKWNNIKNPRACTQANLVVLTS